MVLIRNESKKLLAIFLANSSNTMNVNDFCEQLIKIHENIRSAPIQKWINIFQILLKMPISEQEKQGIADLLIEEEQNMHILFKLASAVTGKVVDIASAQEALDFVCIHIPDVKTLLNKRNITKEVLFKYLHRKRVPVVADFTKSILITKVTECWDAAIKTERSGAESAPFEANPIFPSNTQQENEIQHPINLLARKFSEWFFENYNKNNIKVQDFWSDARLVLRIAADDCIEEKECFDSAGILDILLGCKQRFEFYYNPNLTHAGVQGRMDVHGLVLVLVCGTLHTQQNCVGVFECTFGLMRDPFAENNWKIKTFQITLRSQRAPLVPSLSESDSLRDAMTLPLPMGELS